MIKYWLIHPGLLLFLLVISGSCGHDQRTSDIKNIKLENVKIKRYEKALFSIDPSNLKSELERLRPHYPLFLNGDFSDSSDLEQIYEYITDTMLLSVYKDCLFQYDDISDLENELNLALRHIKYYYPDRSMPDVFTYISGFDYEYPVQYFDGHLVIALDMYLGPDYPRYKRLGLSNYIIRRFSKDYIIRDCMFALAEAELQKKKAGPSLLDLMLIEGKKLWYTKAMVPDIPETILFDYTRVQMEWAMKGEATIWAFLIENEMLYSTEVQPIQKFIGDSPYTSYFGADSPPRLGAYTGYRIIDSYMNRHKSLTPSMLMSGYNAQEILNRSGYKPKM